MTRSRLSLDPQVGRDHGRGVFRLPIRRCRPGEKLLCAVAFMYSTTPRRPLLPVRRQLFFTMSMNGAVATIVRRYLAPS